jgi:hypothetical protein
MVNISNARHSVHFWWKAGKRFSGYFRQKSGVSRTSVFLCGIRVAYANVMCVPVGGTLFLAAGGNMRYMRMVNRLHEGGREFHKRKKFFAKACPLF